METVALSLLHKSSSATIQKANHLVISQLASHMASLHVISLS